MPSVQDKLSTRGYWRFALQPLRYIEKRIPSFDALRKTLELAHVQLRGWDFPHIDPNWGPPAGLTWIAQEIDWSVHVETWRAYLSGQFVHKMGIWTDWQDQAHYGRTPADWVPRAYLPVISAIWSFTEFFEFASRFSQAALVGDDVRLSIIFYGVRDRVLYMDESRRTSFDYPRKAAIDTFPFHKTLDVPTLLGTSRQLAVEASARLFEFFNWAPEDTLLRDLQAELFTKGSGV